jgi:chromosome partitioning protein
MGKIIALSNHKGGVGKTTSTINIGVALSREPSNKRVLLVDFDPQGNLTESFGITSPKNTIYQNLRGDCPITPVEITTKLHLIPATGDLAGSEIELTSETAREYFLKDLLDPIKDKYDFILIDCPPSLGLLTINALTAADEVYIPVKTDFLPLTGLKRLTNVINRIKKRINTQLKVGGIICTQYGAKRNLDNAVVEQLTESFHDLVFKTKIRNNVSLAEAPSVGKDIFSYKSDSLGAEDYFNVTQEIIAKTH